MRTLKLRCIKVTHEDKRVTRFQEPETTVHTVECQFMSPELESDARSAAQNDIADTIYTNAYLGVTLSAERHRELGYEVGKVYELVSM